MAVITNLKLQKNQKRFNVYLDGRFAFALSAEALVKANLKLNQLISEKEAEKLKKGDRQTKLYNKALRFLSYRPRSEKEIEDYLKKKGGRLKAIKKIVSKLKKQNLIGDRIFAEWWIKQRSAFRPRSKFVLMAELRRKGIGEEIIKDSLEKIDDFVLAKKSIQKKISHYRDLSPSEFHQKAAAFLSRRGFNWEVVKKLLEELAEKR